MVVLLEQIVEFRLVIAAPSTLVYFLHTLQVGKGHLIRSQSNYWSISLVEAMDPQATVLCELLEFQHQASQMRIPWAWYFGLVDPCSTDDCIDQPESPEEVNCKHGRS